MKVGRVDVEGEGGLTAARAARRSAVLLHGFVVAALAIACAVWWARGAAAAGEKAAGGAAAVKAAFGEDCEKLLLEALESARREIRVAIYTFTRRNVSRALQEAAERKVKVTVKYDARSMDESPGMTQVIGYLRNHGVDCVPVKMSGDMAKMHHKFAVVDGKRVVTGSWNYTVTGTVSNYENVVSIESADVAKAFSEEFDRIKDR